MVRNSHDEFLGRRLTDHLALVFCFGFVMFRLPLRLVPILFLQKCPVFRLRLVAGTVSPWFGLVEACKSKGRTIAATADREKNNKLTSKKSVQVTLI